MCPFMCIHAQPCGPRSAWKLRENSGFGMLSKVCFSFCFALVKIIWKLCETNVGRFTRQNHQFWTTFVSHSFHTSFHASCHATFHTPLFMHSELVPFPASNVQLNRHTHLALISSLWRTGEGQTSSSTCECIWNIIERPQFSKKN